MKSKFKKTTAWLLTLAMIFTMLPSMTVSVSAASFTSLTVGGVDALTTSSGSGWSYDADSSTLTITGNIGSDSGTPAINAVTEANSQDVLNITVTNNATITGGIYAGGKLNLVVKSGVTLTVNSSGDSHAIASGYLGVNDSLKITGGGTVVAISSGNGDGIKSGGGLWIEGVTVAAQGRNYGLDSGSGRLYIKDNSKVYAVSSQNTAIVAPSNAGHDVVEITGDNTVVVTGYALGNASNNYVPTTIGTASSPVGISCGTLKINCGHLIAGGTMYGISSASVDHNKMENKNTSNEKYEYIGHLTYQQNGGGTHTQKCADGCPVTYTGAVEDCSGTTYCNATVCDKCGQTSGEGDGVTHKGGTATCTAKATCELCHAEYGELDPTNHTGNVSGGYTPVDGGLYHSAAFDCCNLAGGSQEEHISEDGDLTCDKCGGIMIQKVLNEIKSASSGTTLSYSGTLGTDLYPVSNPIKMEIPEGVTVNWAVKIAGEFVTASGTALLTLSGDGTLNLTGSIQNTATTNNNACIALAEGSNVTLVVTESGTVRNASSSASAIKADGGKEIRIEGGTVSGATGISLSTTANTDVTVTGGTITGVTYDAIAAVNATYSGTITVSRGTVTGNSKGIDTKGKVVVSGSPTISGTSGTGNTAIHAGSLEISGSPIISHDVGSGISMYNYDGPVVFKADCNATVTGGQYGINEGLVTVEQGAKATVTGGSANGIDYSGSNPVTVNGELTVKSNSASYDAVYAKNATIAVGTSGKLTAESGSGSDAIQCQELQVSGTVEAIGGTTSGYSGILAPTLTINGGTVTASGNNAVNCAMTSVTDGVIRADGNWIGVWASSKMIVSGNSHIVGTVAGENVFSGVSCSEIKISDEGDYYWCSTTANPTDLHGYTHGGLTGSSEADKTYFELVTKAHLEAGTISTSTITCTCGDAFSTASCSGGTATCASGPVCATCGVVYGAADASQHVWGYSVVDNVITATCSANCGYSETATLTAENATYNGTEHKTATVAYSEGWKGSELAVSYANNTNAGTATASITIGEDITASVKFTIEKATPAVTAPSAIANLIYDSSKQVLINAGSTTGGTIQYSLDNASWSTALPMATNAGEYTVYYKVVGNSNYKDVDSASTIVTIAPVSLADAIVTLDKDTFTYDGQPHKPGVTVELNGKTLTVGTDYQVTYRVPLRLDVDNKPTQWMNPNIVTVTFTNAGNNYYAVIEGIGNYYTENDTTLYARFQIEPKMVMNPTFAGLEASFLYQNGEEIKPTFDLMDGDKNILDSEYTVAYSNNTAVGTATITVTDNAGGNYTVSGSTTFNIVVHEHAWTYTASGNTITATCNGNIGTCPDAVQSFTLNASDAVYSGNPVEADVTRDGTDLSYTLRYTGTNYDSADAPTNAGDYTVTMTVGDKRVSDTFTISPKDISVVQSVQFSLTQNSFTYSGEAPTLDVTGVDNSVGGYPMQEGTDYTVGTAMVNAGSHKLTVAGIGNYTGTVELDYTITAKNIAAADIAVNGVNASYTYTGNPIQPSVTSVTADGKTLDSNEYEVTYGTNTTVAQGGSVIVKLKGNYSGEKTVTFTILASDQADFSISGATTATYGDAPITLNAAGGSGDGEITWEITSGDQFASIDKNGVVTIKGAGAVTVKATKAADGNYKEKVDTHEITISKATVSAGDFSYSAPSDLVYSKTAKEATVTGNSAYGAITIKYYSDSRLTTVVQPINVGTYYVGITTAGGDNYEAVTAPMYVGSFEITARTVTVTAAAKTMQYGDDVPELTYTHNLLEGDSFTGSLATTATKTSDVGEYDITIGDLANSNYSISFHGAKLTITKADGPAAPTVTGSYVDNGMTYTYTVNAISGAEYSMDGTTWQDSNVFENLVAGQKYTFYARIKETKNVLAGAIGKSAEVDLSKLPGKGTVTIADWTYGENAKAPVTNSTTGNTVDSYLYESTDGKGYSSANAPTNAGEYKLTVTFAATDTHNGTTASDTFTIKKATPVVDAPTGLTATYGDTLASVQLPEGWAWKDAATTEVGNAGENSFTVIYTKDDSGNYNTVEKTVAITVAPKVVTAIVTVAGENFIFNGSEQKPGVTVKDGDITIPESEYTVSYKDNTNAGTATVTITDKDGGNYTVTGETTFAIAKKASSALSGVEREFMRTIATTGNEIDVEAMLPDDHGTATYTITSNGYTVLENVAVDANGKLVFDTKTSAAAASDTITVKVEMQNYTDVTLTVSIILNDKAPQEITGVSAAAGLIYNGEAQQGYTGTPASEKYTSAYEITYTGRSNTYNSSAAPTNAGDYTVTFKIPDSDLYYSGNISINFTIGKAQATVTADDKEAYIGSRMPELTYKVSGLIGSDTISVELGCDANMNRAGETPIVVTATDPNGNYEITTVNGTLTVKYYPYIPIITPTYPPVIDNGDNGDVVVSPTKPEKGDTVTIVPNPDNGYEVDEIIVTDKNGNPVTVVDNGDGTYSFKQPSGKVNIEVTFKEIVNVCPGDKTCPMYGYTDLDMTAWYHDGVHFCIANDLMTGTASDTFAPGMTTSRAMIVTILWRLEGKPVVNYAMSFKDVAADTWYTEAVRWAQANKIVSGYSDEAFGPNDVITREQLATILYRYEQYKGGGFVGAWMFRMDYVDLADVSDWAYEAMCWNTINGIVNGKPGKILDPKGTATRAEAAAMLNRYCEKEDNE